MTTGDKPPSFNPRTWVPGPMPPREPPSEPPPRDQPAGPSPERLSFDPKAWAPRPETATPARRRPVAPMLAGGVVLALVAAGAGWWALQPKAQPKAIAPAAAAKAAAPQPGATTSALVLAGPSELAAALAASGATPAEAQAAAAEAVRLLAGSGGELRVSLTLSAGAPRRIERLEAIAADGAGAVVTRNGDRFAGEAVAAKLVARERVVRGEMDADSFYSSAVAAGVTDSLIPTFAQAFAFDFDFQREIHPGDIFEAVFRQAENAEGRPVGPPELLFAGLTTEAKSAALYRFTPEGEEPGWFDGNGRSIVRAFMRTPIDGARVSSSFGYRKHPILGYQKLHRGVDFAAPVGTPIYAAGDATVEFAGPKGPNGNFVALRHDNGWRTLYLHMNAFGEGIVAGARVRQGQRVGEVGTTGRSTGPHLHYEVHINGEPVDPMTVQVEEGRTLA
ncbi:MAG: peptidoglycan DD-metalloendopeptidase family protein, partial [Caulobacteraceae bacterium]|nr:peptidoglycan DD-metalloendopeptidase family protein [Caulobacteraceae bacterium]